MDHCKSFGVVARIKAPKGCVGVWVNIYKVGDRMQSGGAYERRVRADNVAQSHRHDCVYIHVRRS